MTDEQSISQWDSRGGVPAKLNEKNKLLDEFVAALNGERNADQKRIAEVALEWACLLLRKNSDYGGSVWREPVLAPDCPIDAAMRVRMSDKVARLNRLLSGNRAEVEESLEDTMRDLGAYCLLYLARPKVMADDCGE